LSLQSPWRFYWLNNVKKSEKKLWNVLLANGALVFVRVVLITVSGLKEVSLALLAILIMDLGAPMAQRLGVLAKQNVAEV